MAEEAVVETSQLNQPKDNSTNFAVTALILYLCNWGQL